MHTLNLNTPSDVFPFFSRKILAITHFTTLIRETTNVDNHLAVEYIGRDVVRGVGVHQVGNGYQSRDRRASQHSESRHKTIAGSRMDMRLGRLRQDVTIGTGDRNQIVDLSVHSTALTE
jgi:hypothetical protein